MGRPEIGLQMCKCIILLQKLQEQRRGFISGLHYLHLIPIFISMCGNLIV